MIPGFSVIAESINNSVPSTQQMYDNGDIAGLLELAKMQDVAGAAYLDVNVGPRPADLLAKMIAEIQTVSSKPLSIDSPDYAQAEAGLKTYDPAKANGLKPILNSVSPMRTEMFKLYSIQPFRPILLSSEQLVDGAGARVTRRKRRTTPPKNSSSSSWNPAPAPPLTTALSTPTSPRSAPIWKTTSAASSTP